MFLRGQEQDTKPIREEFTSYGGSYIALGHHKNKQSNNTLNFKDQFLTHTTVSPYNQQESIPGGLAHGKFKKGFIRRQKDQINYEGTAEEKQRNDELNHTRAQRNAQLNLIRKNCIVDQDNRSGYNIISGEVKNTSKLSNQRGGIRILGDGLGPEAPARGNATLRESEGRFFTPLGTGKTHEYRQEILYKEGLAKDRFCGIIQTGKPDIPSYGIEDQFSKSEYMNNNAITKNGLFEARVPGKYTPRKIPGNPSGNPQIVERWNTKVDVNNRTLQGIL